MAAPGEENEKTIISKAREGDYSAFDSLVSLYEDRIYNLAVKMLSDEQDARDVVQETFLSAYKNLESFREESSFYTWLNRIAVNFCFMKLRERKKEERSISLDEVHPFPEGRPAGVTIASWDFSPEKFTVESELAEKMKSALLELPEKYRVVFYLKDIDGLGNEKIGEILELSLPAVKSRLNRARLFLRKKLAPYFEERR